MGLKPFRRIHVWRRCRRMPWFTWAGAWPMLAPTWLRRLLAEHLIPVRREGDLPLVCFPNGDVVAAPPGTRRPVLEVLTQYQAARYLDHYEARTALRDGDVAGRKVGREWKFSRQALIDWIGTARSAAFMDGSEAEAPLPKAVPGARPGRTRATGLHAGRRRRPDDGFSVDEL